MKKLDILILEDETSSIMTLKRILKDLGHNEYVATDIEKAKEQVKNNSIDILIADINLHKEYDGIDVANSLNLPTIFTTGYYKEYAKKSATIKDAEYIKKPYDKDEVEGVMTRLIEKYDLLNDVIRVGEYSYHKKEKHLLRLNDDIKLNNIETKIVSMLFRNLDQIIPYSVIENELWGSKIVDNNTLRVYISRLRKKTQALLIETISKEGLLLKSTK